MLVGCVSFISCSEDREIEGPDIGMEDGSLRIKASLTQSESTRAYQESGQIMTGTYYMTYPKPSNDDNYSVCTVNFYDGRGVTTTQNGYELKWQEVGVLSYDHTQTVFWLDNVPMPENDPQATVIEFTDDYNPFVAGVFDDIDGKNDLLWGYVHMEPEKSQEISLTIHHYMARLNVIVTIDNSNENSEKINFEEGKVRITNVIHKGVNYTRTNGSIGLGPDPEYKELVLKGDDDEWGSTLADTENENIIYYQTLNYVLPPQQLLTDENRPRLVIEVPQSDGTMRTYSGVIPRVMNVNGNPQELAFDPEKNLTLKVKISQDLLRIESIYADVQNWVNKGTHLVSGTQAGIYNGTDLTTLVEIYNDPSRETDLSRYGYRIGDNWVFDVFTDLTVDAKEVKNKMASGPDFSFDLTQHGLTIIREDGAIVIYDAEHAAEAAEALYLLLREGVEPTEFETPDNGD